YVNGPTLREVLKSGRRFEPLAVVKLLRGMLDVLGDFHQEGQAHGGIKPSNVFLARNDRIVLGDRSLPLPPSVSSDGGRLASDYRYASPEQFQHGGEILLASDVYALGCVAYELFKGAPPFVADNVHKLYWHHNHDAVPLASGAVVDDWLAGL